MNKGEMKTRSKKKASAKGKQRPKADYDRGKIEAIALKNSFTFNGSLISKAIIQIDHINYGLDKSTNKLNTKRRSNFTISDVEKFLVLLDEEYIAPSKSMGRVTRFELRINSPIVSKFYGKEFILIFELDYDLEETIHTITLFPNW